MWTNKISRAKQLKKELQKELESFFIAHPYRIDTKLDPQSKRLIYFVTKADQVPEEISQITATLFKT
ncbi:MAG: hypothetical protein A2687_01245 [Candidatus Levybacteria bacterium RIFCSPHIGHO2_01_FULL_38_26]|nr:MAG: hypothetical protein A2687_01245 [Candidatus Levybacteria bacterium RIFCSPHIGHO2_01_FULL_38_26]